MERALEFGQLGMEKAEAANAVECVCAAKLCVGMGQLQRQELAQAQTTFDESVRLADFTGAESFRNMGEGALAMTEFFGGRPEAIHSIESAMSRAHAIDDQYAASMFSQTLGEIYAQHGEVARADDYINRALEYYRSHAMRPYIARALQAQAQLHEQQGRAAEASQARAEADSLWRECNPISN